MTRPASSAFSRPGAPDRSLITQLILAGSLPSPIASLLTGITAAINVTDQFTDPASVTLVEVSDPTNGTAVVNADNTITYTPTADFNGEDSFTYTANDGTVDSNVATVTITVNAVNDAPVAGDDSAPWRG